MSNKRISRKDMAKMSAGDLWQVSKSQYAKLLRYLYPYKGRFALGLFFAVLFGLVQFASIFVIYFTFSAVLPGEVTFQPPSFLTDFIDGWDIGGTEREGRGSLAAVLVACALIPTTVLLRGGLNYLNTYCMMWVGVRVLSDIRTDLFNKIMGQSLDFFNKQKSGDLIQTIFNQTRMAQQALTTIMSEVVKQPISIISLCGALVFLDWKFAVSALVVFPLCLLPVIILSRKVRHSAAREQKETGMLMVVMQEAFAGVRMIKSYAREDYESAKFTDANSKMMRMIVRWQKALEIVGPMVETVASLGIGAGLFYAWWYEIDAPTFMTMYIALIALYPHAKGLSRIHVLLQKCLVATTKVFELMETLPTIRDAPDAKPLVNCQGAVEFRDVRFSYIKDTPAVKKVSLVIEPGQNIALVGASGAGKSTLFSLLLRFYDPDSGAILVDGQDIRSLTQTSLRDHIGLVSQETFLFHDSIYHNILYGNLQATKEEVIAAAEKAYAHEFILQQPKGYDTVIGDKGCMLSGGQQQRLSIARAMLRNAPILLLDEAMSALDSESEKKVQEAIETLEEGKTVIAIAHRLSTILKADKIVVMDQGQIKEVGSHQELLAESTYYRKLYDIQFLEHKEPAAT